MSEKAALHARIDACRREIEQIRIDIGKMNSAITTMNGFITQFKSQQTDVSDFDMTVGDTWRRKLCEEAISIQKTIVSDMGSSLDECSGVIEDINVCISNAEQKIRELEDEIRRCEDRIAQIEAEERAAAEREAARRLETAK